MRPAPMTAPRAAGSAALLAGTLVGCMALASCAWFAAPGARHPYPVEVGVAFKDRPFAPEMVVVPAGVFWMGSTPDEASREGRSADTAAAERPRHRVEVAQELAVGRHLVTR